MGSLESLKSRKRQVVAGDFCVLNRLHRLDADLRIKSESSAEANT